MNEPEAIPAEYFVAEVRKLYDAIGEWLSSTPLITSQEEFELKEEALGDYRIEELIISEKEGDNVAELVPVGADVIGANGRVDLVGRRDRAAIVLLEPGGPSVTSRISAGEHIETSETPLLRGVDEPGWYWVQDRRRGKAHKLNKEIFSELLVEVSDYAWC